eukprot:6195658-Pleurochrysis_carterae.AAC.2
MTSNCAGRSPGRAGCTRTTRAQKGASWVSTESPEQTTSKKRLSGCGTGNQSRNTSICNNGIIIFARLLRMNAEEFAVMTDSVVSSRAESVGIEDDVLAPAVESCDGPARENEGNMSAHLASSWGRSLVATAALRKFLFSSQRSSRYRNPEGFMLYNACARGQTSVVREYISEGVNVDWQDDLGYAAIFAAARRGHIQVTLAVTIYPQQLHHRALSNVATSEAEMVSAALQRVLEALLSAGANPNLSC